MKRAKKEKTLRELLAQAAYFYKTSYALMPEYDQNGESIWSPKHGETEASISEVSQNRTKPNFVHKQL